MKWIKRFAGAMLLISACNWIHVLLKHFLPPGQIIHWDRIVYDLLMIFSSLLASWVLFKDANRPGDPTPPQL
ncbi:MAG TPA: hypothetical protein VGM54_23105 [Chthoniobacter sp.]|jgi:hypothetical protein